jgi:hypothetical protein
LEVLGCYNLVSEPRFSTLSLDGPDKGPLDLRFQVEIVSGGTKFEPYIIYECQGVAWLCYKIVVDVVFGHREREREHNTRSVGAVGYGWEERRSLTTIKSREGAGELSWKPFRDSTIGKSEMC